MVSSKCLKTSSPSPLRSLAALIPPWAQTECERLTGTMEKRSTLPPASAILMTAARPARPPPTTMILGAAAIVPGILSCSASVREQVVLTREGRLARGRRRGHGALGDLLTGEVGGGIRVFGTDEG